MTEVTADTLREIGERWAKATPGPWSLDVMEEAPDAESVQSREGHIALPLAGNHHNAAHNGEAIAHAPEDIALLRGLVEELAALIVDSNSWTIEGNSWAARRDAVLRRVGREP